jgi:N-methylhydantoinase B
MGIVREYEMLADRASINVRGDRAKFPPRGLNGGDEGARSRYRLCEAGGEREIPSKYSGQIQRGERLIVVTPGGGGYGPPEHRDPALQAADLANGKVTWGAPDGDDKRQAEVDTGRSRER